MNLPADYFREPKRANRFSYVHNSPLNMVDFWGLDTYRIDRFIGKDRAREMGVPLTHTFAATTDEQGTVTDTYSWGNEATPDGWSHNAGEDLKSAQEAIDNNMAYKEGDSSLDPYVGVAYDQRKNERHIWMPHDNCKHENKELIEDAVNLKQRSQLPDGP